MTTTHLPGKFVWFELVTGDVSKAKGFYGELFGWKTESMPMQGFDYTIVKNGETSIGGMTPPEGPQPIHWHTYLSVSDVDGAAKIAKKAGGTVLAEPFDVPNVGRMARIRDPQGASFSVFKSSQSDPPDGPRPPGSFYWNELATSDDLGAMAFYEKVAGFTYSAMDMGPFGTYRIAKAGGADRGGMMKSPDPKAPSMWLPYVRVEDCDGATARAKKLGAKVIAEPSDVPNVGRFSILEDPSGALIAIITTADKA